MTLDEHYQRFKNDLGQKSNEELVHAFNIETQHRGWVGIRGAYLRALDHEFLSRPLDTSVIRHTSGLRLKYPVYISNGKLKRLKII